MVPTYPTIGLRHRFDTASTPRSTIVPDGRASPSSQLTRSSRLETLWRGLGADGVSDSVVNLLVDKSRKSTQFEYETTWDNWFYWCGRGGTDPLSPSIVQSLTTWSNCSIQENLLVLLTYIHSSMLSSTLPPSNGVPIGQLPAVKQLLRGAFNRNPPAQSIRLRGT